MNSVHPENWTSKSYTDRNAEIVRRLIDAGEADKALEIAQERGSLSYVADDGNAEVEYEHALTPEEAAQDYVNDGSWGDVASTTWVNVYVWARYTVGDVSVDEDDRSHHKIALNPDEPECSEGSHDWRSPYCLLGGLEENPGVWGNAGGVIVKEVCIHCGCKRIRDTWAQDREDGTQGLDSVEYEEGAYDADDLGRAREELGLDADEESA
jgi:hypothetical protein